MEMGTFSTLEETMEKSGYLKCQIDISHLLQIHEKLLIDSLRVINRELSTTQGTLRHKKLMEFNRVSGELDALRSVWMKLNELSFSRDGLT